MTSSSSPSHDLIRDIQSQYLDAGADILTTNTFTATRYGLSEFGLEDRVYEINCEAAHLARQVADDYTEINPDKPRFVAGSIGPTNKTLSISPDVNDPGYRDVTFDELADTYAQAARGLLDGGAHILLVETTFDTLNAKAALYAVETVFEQTGSRVPVMASFTAIDLSGRNLSGQTAEAFYASVSHVPLLSVGINCSLGSDQMRPFLASMANVSAHFVSCYPNAGLPNEFGEYDETAAHMAANLREFVQSGFANIVGSCCGSRPEHTRAIAEAVAGIPPRQRPQPAANTLLSGIETLEIRPDSNFINVGERANVTGSARFRRLIRRERYEEAVNVARQQVENGAQVLDINMDEGMLDSEAAMERYLKLLAAEPDISRVPIMVDSSRFDVIEAGLKCLQGKGIVNSISLKEGEDEFIRQARVVRRYGAAVIVMAFDERGQADTVQTARSPYASVPTASSPSVSVSLPRTSSSTPISSPSPPASRSTTTTPSPSSRSRSRAKASLPPLPRQWGRLQRLLLLPRQRRRARGHPLRLPLPRHPRGHGHGHRQRRTAPRL